MFFLSDVSEFARPLGAKDKQKRKRRNNLIRNVAIGLGAVGVVGGLGYLALKGKSKPNVNTVIKPTSVSKETTTLEEFVIPANSGNTKSQAELNEEWLKQAFAESERRSNSSARKTYLGAVELAEQRGNINSIERILKKEGFETNKKELQKNIIKDRKKDLSFDYEGDDTYNGYKVGQIMREKGGLKTIKDKKLRKKIAKNIATSTVPKVRNKYEQLRKQSRKQRIIDWVNNKTDGIGREKYEISEQRAWYSDSSELTTFGRKIGSKDKGMRRLRDGRVLRPNKILNANDGKHKKIVLASKVVNGKKKYKVVRFGAHGYGHNYSPEARKNFNKRFAGIKKKDGSKAIQDRFSPAYWSKKVLWSKNTKPSGKGRFAK